MIFRSCFALTLLFALGNPGLALAREGDWSSTGGGSGVACFPAEAQAKQAEGLIRKGKLLPAPLLNAATIQILDRWEMDRNEGEGGRLIRVVPNAKWKNIHASIHKAIRHAAPLFADRLQVAASWANFSHWEKISSLNVLEDAKPLFEIPANCRQIQLVLRYSAGGAIKPGDMTTGSMKVKVVFVPSYFEKLSPIDQAMLVLHEELYILGAGIGHDSSDIIRGFTRTFFSQEFVSTHILQKEFHLLNGEEHLRLKTLMIKYFGDYLDMFAKVHGPADGPRYSSRANLKVYIDFINKYREPIVRCREAGGGHMECTDRYIHPFKMAKELNEEQAFVYLSIHHFEQGIAFLNADYVMRPQEDDKYYVAAVTTVCGEVEKVTANPEAQALKDKALAYCAGWKKQNAFYLGMTQGKRSN